MLHCPKRKFPIPSMLTNPDSTKERQTFLVTLADSVRAAPEYNFQEAKCTLTTAFNLEHWNYYLKDYNGVIVTAFLQYQSFSDYIAQELQYKAIIGPFQCKLCNFCKVWLNAIPVFRAWFTTSVFLPSNLLMTELHVMNT